jgi:glycosyltransferase involved in cell wall biosynthesis
MEQLAADLGIGREVEFAGFVANPGAAYARFDLFALATHYEGQGLVLLEAMEHSLPIVATDLPPIRETLGPAFGAHLATPGDPEGLARALNRLLDDPAERSELGRIGRDRVRTEFDLPSWCRRVIDLYDRFERD